MYDYKQYTKSLLFNIQEGFALDLKFKIQSNLYKFFSVFGRFFTNYDETILNFKKEMDIETTSELIDDWEKEYGIPDVYFLGNGTLEERRRDILSKKLANGISTINDFTYYFELLGYNVNVVNEQGNLFGFPLTFPFIFPPDETEENFILIIEFLEDYPNLDNFKKYIETLIPANGVVLYR